MFIQHVRALCHLVQESNYSVKSFWNVMCIFYSNYLVNDNALFFPT